MKIYDTIIEKYFERGSVSYHYYYTHCKAVSDMALKIAALNPQLNADTEFIETAAMLHDIGICKTNATQIGCYGDQPYIKHGPLGREILEQEGLYDLAPICERHVGTGITKEEIIKNKLPLPHRDMLPISIEEKIVCYADKFFSKSKKDLSKPIPIEKIRRKMKKLGERNALTFEEFVELFGSDYIYE